MNTYRIEISNDQRMLIACALLYYANRDSLFKDNEGDIKGLADKFVYPDKVEKDGSIRLFCEPKE